MSFNSFQSNIIEFDNYKLFTYRYGSGEPCIVFLSGYGESANVWDLVAPSVSDFTSVFLYDRDGIGNSYYSGNPRDSEAVVKSLRILLERSEINYPIILVGHSFGSLCTRLFASIYPEDVIGMILVDPTPENILDFINEEDFNSIRGEGTYEEILTSCKQITKSKIHLRNMPVVVISAGIPDYHTKESYTNWLKAHREILNISNNSKQIISTRGAHNLHMQEPALVINEIKEMFAELRGRSII